MDIFEFADTIKKDLIIIRHQNSKNGFTCEFEHAETKKDELDVILFTTCGIGKTAEKAIDSYTKKIRGKLLVFNAMTTKRKEYQVPRDLVS